MELKGLEILDLENNPNLTKAEVDKLQRALPKCEILSERQEMKALTIVASYSLWQYASSFFVACDEWWCRKGVDEKDSAYFCRAGDLTDGDLCGQANRHRFAA